MDHHQPSRSSSSPTSGPMMAAPRPSSPNNTIIPARSSLDYSSSPRTPSPLNPNSQSPSPTPTPPSRTSLLPTSTPPAGPARLHSFSGRDPSPVRDALIPMSRAKSAPSSTSPLPVVLSSSQPPPTIVFGSSTTPSLFRARSPSRHSPRTNPEHDHEPEEESATTPASTWWSHKLQPPRPWAEPSKRKRTVPPEQAEAYVHTRSVRHLSVPGFHSRSSRINSAPSMPSVASLVPPRPSATKLSLLASISYNLLRSLVWSLPRKLY